MGCNVIKLELNVEHNQNTTLRKVLTDFGKVDFNSYTKLVKAMFDKPIKTFFTTYLSYSGMDFENNKQAVVDMNSVLTMLYNNDVVEIDFDNPYKNGVKRLTRVNPDYAPPLTCELIERVRKDVVYQVDLSTSVTKSELFKDTGDFQSLVALKYLSKLQNSRSRGIEFTLTLKDVERLLKVKRCYYSGVELTLSGIHSLTFDRKDSTLGYTKENTVSCSCLVNGLKAKLMEDQDATSEMTDGQLKMMLMKFSELFN